jgi:hypothetical protein
VKKPTVPSDEDGMVTIDAAMKPYKPPTLRALGTMSAVTRKSGTVYDLGTDQDDRVEGTWGDPPAGWPPGWCWPPQVPPWLPCP